VPRTDVARAINLTVEPVATYHTDPRGWAMFRALAAAIAGPLMGRRGSHVYPSVHTDFHGPVRSPQQLRGAGHLGTGRAVAPRASTLQDEKEANPLNAAANEILYERMIRGMR